jgi:hypothetical protein
MEIIWIVFKRRKTITEKKLLELSRLNNINCLYKLTREISYLASNAAKPKVKEIDGESFQLWII